MLDILTNPTKEGYPRQVFLLTDGQVVNREQCINEVRKHSDTTRVFTFAISSAADNALCEGMAEAGHGSCEVILDDEDMEEKVVRQLKRAMTPALSDISLDWGALADAVSPYYLPPIFAGNRMIVYAFLKKTEKEEKGKITLKGVTALSEFKTTVEIDPSTALNSDLFHKLGGKAMIRDLQERRSFMHDKNQTLKKGYTNESVKNEMIRLSTKYGVICPYTAFVAVEEDENKQKTEKHDSQANKSKESAKEEEEEEEEAEEAEKEEKCKDALKVKRRRQINVDKKRGMGRSIAMRNKKGMKGLIITQNFNGSWNLAAVSEGLSVSVDVIKKAIPDATKPEMETVWATFVAVAFLELLCLYYKVKWELIAEKAKRWLKKQGVSWQVQASQFIKSAGIKA